MLNDTYALDSGTSMSSPVVTGAAALLKAASPDLSPLGVKSKLIEEGSKATTVCDSGPRGYFENDPDSLNERHSCHQRRQKLSWARFL